MVWLILGVVAVLIALVALKVVTVVVGVVAMVLALVGLAAFGEWRDKPRQRGIHNPAAAFDPNKPNLYGRSSESHWEPPTPYIDHPDGGGAPPGVDRGDDRPPPK
jgi:Short repeat of unknown function (DUF308)